jgi:hypothetical protein
MDKTGRTGSTAQMINGGFLLASFFGVRIVYGGMIVSDFVYAVLSLFQALLQSYSFLQTLLQIHDSIPLAYTILYFSGNVLLQFLNWFWFYKMISALRKRFEKGDEDAVVYNPGERTRLAPAIVEPAELNERVEDAAREGERRSAANIGEYGTR